MKVLVINKNGHPLMPTSPRNARRLLKNGKAKIVGRNPLAYCQEINAQPYWEILREARRTKSSVRQTSRLRREI